MDAFGEGYHLTITADGEATSESADYFGQNGVNYRTVTLTTLSTPYTYGDYGSIAVSDYATYAAATDYLYYNRLYDNHYLYVYGIYSVSAGYLGMDFIQFQPE